MAFQGNDRLRGTDEYIKLSRYQLEEIIMCKDCPLYFIDNYTRANDVADNTLIDLCKSNTVQFANSRDHKIILSYLLWSLIFEEHKSIIITDKTILDAEGILVKLKDMFMALPKWIQPGVIHWDRKCISVCSSTIRVSPTFACSVRGRTIDVLYMNNTESTNPSYLNEFVRCVFPVMMSSDKHKIILSS